METASKESQMVLAIQSLQNDPNLTRRAAARTYNVSETSLRRRMNGTRARQDTRPNSTRLTELEENVIVTYIMDLDSRGFAPRIPDVEEIANVILAERDASRVGIHWASNFVKRQPQLKTRLSRVYDY